MAGRVMTVGGFLDGGGSFGGVTLAVGEPPQPQRINREAKTEVFMGGYFLLGDNPKIHLLFAHPVTTLCER